MKQLSDIHVAPLYEISMKFESVKTFESCSKSTVEMYMKAVLNVYFRFIISTLMLISDILFSLHLMFILLLAGDTETNPGPRMKKKSTDVKKKVDRERKRQDRHNEASETKSRRLETDRKRKSQTKDTESAERKSKRLKTAKEKMAKTRASETPETKSRRLETDRKRTSQTRDSESPKRKSKRLETVKEKMANNRASETIEMKARRLETVKKKMANKRHLSTTYVPSIQEVTETFQEKVKYGPVHVCTSCHRLMYRESVVKYEEKKYEKLSHKQIGPALQKFLYKSTDGQIWICTTYHRKLKQGKVPAQCKVNNLDLDVVPDELSKLNSIEIRLVSKRIPFMKMVALPRGRQTAIHGPAVNIPTNLDTIFVNCYHDCRKTLKYSQ